MYRKYRIIILIISMLVAMVFAFTIAQSLHYVAPKEKLDQYASIVVGITTISFFLNLITPIYFIIGDLIYVLRKNNIPKILKILNILLITQWFSMVSVLILTSYSFIRYIFLVVNILIWILQIIFTFRWNKSVKR